MCSKVKYCGETCSLQSWEEYHSVECQNLFLLQSVGLCHLAARIVMTAGLDQVLEAVADNLDNHPQLQDSISYFHSKSLEDGISEKRIQYLRIYSLAEHSDKMAPIDMFTYAKTAAGVTYWLQTHTTFFGDKTEEDIWAIGGAILRHTCQLISNAQQVYAFRRDSGNLLHLLTITSPVKRKVPTHFFFVIQTEGSLITKEYRSVVPFMHRQVS